MWLGQAFDSTAEHRRKEHTLKIQSMEYRTECIFAGFDGHVIQRDGYTVLRTPSNPTYHWGNFLVFEHPPHQDDMTRWVSHFIDEIASKQPTKHILFGWDRAHCSEDEERGVAAFVNQGMEVEWSPTMTTTRICAPSSMHPDVEVLPLQSDAHWEAATVLQIQSRDKAFGLASYTVFKRAQMARYRQMVQAGLGCWFGAFLHGELVADLGIFHDGLGVARYQSVETRADQRRQGICARLVFDSATQFEQQHGPITQWVIVAETTGAAARVYQRAGFQSTELSPSLTWWRGLNAFELLDGRT